MRAYPSEAKSPSRDPCLQFAELCQSPRRKRAPLRLVGPASRHFGPTIRLDNSTPHRRWRVCIGNRTGIDLGQHEERHHPEKEELIARRVRNRTMRRPTGPTRDSNWLHRMGILPPLFSASSWRIIHAVTLAARRLYAHVILERFIHAAKA